MGLVVTALSGRACPHRFRTCCSDCPAPPANPVPEHLYTSAEFDQDWSYIKRRIWAGFELSDAAYLASSDVVATLCLHYQRNKPGKNGGWEWHTCKWKARRQNHSPGVVFPVNIFLGNMCIVGHRRLTEHCCPVDTRHFGCRVPEHLPKVIYRKYGSRYIELLQEI